MTATHTWRNLDPDKRERVVDAALDEFAEHGFAGASVNRLVRGLGIAKGSIFKYFESKEGLFRHVFEHAVGRFGDTLRQAREETRDAPLPDRVRASVLAGLGYIEAHPRIYRIYLKMLFQENMPFRETILREIRGYSAKFLRSLVADAEARGELAQGVRPEAVVFVLDAVWDRFLQARTVPYMDSGLGLHPDAAHSPSPEAVHDLLDQVLDVLRPALTKSA